MCYIKEPNYYYRRKNNNNIYEEYIIPEPINEENNFDLHESLIEENSVSHLIQVSLCLVLIYFIVIGILKYLSII